MPSAAEATTLDPADPWGTFQRSAFRLETLPWYRMPQEEGRMELYLSGAAKPESYNADWHDKLEAWARAGKIVQRVRVVRPPLTDYQRRQFAWAYPGNLAAGEDTRMLDGAKADELGLPNWDFWFFDDHLVRKQVYTEDGTFVGREVLPDADPAEFRRYRELALSHATVFWTYRRLTGT
ncbi:MAG: DUF6879 family protein [Pseudonocardia sp.]